MGGGFEDENECKLNMYVSVFLVNRDIYLKTEGVN